MHRDQSKGDGGDFTSWIPSPDKKEFYATRAEKDPILKTTPLKKTCKSNSINRNSDASSLDTGEGQKVYFAPLIVSPDLLISSQKKLNLLGATLSLKWDFRRAITPT